MKNGNWTDLSSNSLVLRPIKALYIFTFTHSHTHSYTDFGDWHVNMWSNSGSSFLPKDTSTCGLESIYWLHPLIHDFHFFEWDPSHTGSSCHVCSSQVLYGGKDGRGLQAQYVVLDSDDDRLVPTHSLAPTHTDGPVGSLRPLGRSFFFPGGKPPSASFCWFSPEEACSGGVFSDLYTLWELF